MVILSSLQNKYTASTKSCSCMVVSSRKTSIIGTRIVEPGKNNGKDPSRPLLMLSHMDLPEGGLQVFVTLFLIISRFNVDHFWLTWGIPRLSFLSDYQISFPEEHRLASPSENRATFPSEGPPASPSGGRPASPSNYRSTSPSEDAIVFGGFVVPPPPFSVKDEVFPRFVGTIDERGSETEFLPMLSQQDPSLEHYLADNVDGDELDSQRDPSPLSRMQDDSDAVQGLLELSLQPPFDPHKKM